MLTYALLTSPLHPVKMDGGGDVVDHAAAIRKPFRLGPKHASEGMAAYVSRMIMVLKGKGDGV